MTLQDLKQRATASELTLIEKTESLLREEAVSAMRKAAVEFIQRFPPPDREILHFEPDALRDWLGKFTKTVNPEKP
jgi:hypothetical protein